MPYKPRPFWSETDLEVLRKLVPFYVDGNINKDGMSKILGRSWGSIIQKASEIGLSCNTKSGSINVDALKNFLDHIGKKPTGKTVEKMLEAL